MTHPTHLSDDELRLAATDKPTATPLEQIEGHVADCASCQARLLDLVADSAWREQLVGGLKSMSSFSSGDPPDFLAESVSGHGAAPNGPTGDAFDLQTVERMLLEILEPSTQAESLGRLGRYDVQNVIGCGGMGVVLRGFDRELHRPVAIKMVLPRLASRGMAKQRFLREARAAATVLHPNVVGIHDIHESEGVPWFIMPLIVGPSLRTLVEQNGPPTEQDIVRIGVQIASGLAAAHSQGLVHRDIKPENILVDNQVNRVVITDFGLAQRECDDAMTQTGMIAGSLHYMSPEQSRGEDVDGRSDLFSLGSVLYFLATGAAPFRAPTAMGVLHKIGSAEHPDLRVVNPTVSQMVVGVIAKLLQKHPEDRFASAAEVESFLSDYLAHLHRPTQRPAPAIPGGETPRARIWSPLGIALAVVAAALLVAGTWWAATRWGGGGNGANGPAGPGPVEERRSNAGTSGAGGVPTPAREQVRERVMEVPVAAPHGERSSVQPKDE